MGGQRHAPAALPPGKTRYPLYRRLGRPRAGLDRCGISRPPPGFDPRTAQLIASRYTVYAIPRMRSWLRDCTTSRKVAVSIPDGVIAIFHCHIPSGRTMALELTHPLTEMSTSNISWGVTVAGA